MIQNFWGIFTWVFTLQLSKYTFDNSIRLIFQSPKFSLYNSWNWVANYERLMRWGKKKGTSFGYLCAMRCNGNNIFFTSNFFPKTEIKNQKFENENFFKVVNHQEWEKKVKSIYMVFSV